MVKKRKKPAAFSEEIRRAIVNSDLSQYQICKETGIDKGHLSRFVHGTSSLSLDSVDKIAALLGWSLDVPPSGKGK